MSRAQDAATLRRARRVEGWYPHALQRACECEAALMVFTKGLGPHNTTAYRRYVQEFNPRNLHAAIGRILKLKPTRRIL